MKIGGYASSTEPTAVADGDRVNAYLDTKGYQHTIIDSLTSASTIYAVVNTAAAGQSSVVIDSGISSIGFDIGTENQVRVTDGSDVLTIWA